MKKSIIIALGGNALSPKEEAGTIYQQFAHTRESIDNIMHFVDLEYNICLTHGNGPQVGDELYRMELTHEIIPPLPLGVCVAETQGSIGYMVQQSLQNVLKEKKIKFIEQTFNKLLEHLTKKLNGAHGLNFEKTYWKILISL